MLRHRLQLDGVVAHVTDIGGQLLGQVPVVDEVAVVPLFPGAQMDFIDVQRRAVHRVCGLLFAEGLVTPAETADVVQLAGGGGTGLRVESVGVRLLMDLTVGSPDGELVRGICLEPGNEALPDLPLAFEGGGGLVPVVEVSHHGNRLGVGRPNPEGPAVLSTFFLRMSTKPAPTIRQFPFVETVSLVSLCHGSSSSPCASAGRAGSLIFSGVNNLIRTGFYFIYYTSCEKYRQGCSCRKSWYMLVETP